MRIKHHISCFVLAAACLFQGNNLTIYAKESWPAGPEIATENAIVMEAETGIVLYEKNANEQLNPASITKILTALLAIENSQLSEEVTFSYDSVHKTEGSGIWRDVDEVMTMEQCLYALMLNSANECAYAIAEHTGGTYGEFIRMMNEKATALGCKDTNFNNPHGLPDENHYTSCYDMALIGREAIKNEIFRQIAATVKYTIPPTNKHPDESTFLNNHHKMLLPESDYYYEYSMGGKTGYTIAAGNTLVTFAEKDGMTLICVVMKEKTPDHYTDTRALLDYCFNNFQMWNISENEINYAGATVPKSDFLSEGSFVDMDKNAYIVLPKSVDFSGASTEIVYQNVTEEVVGTLQYSYAGKAVGQTDIKTTGQAVKEYPFAPELEAPPTPEKTPEKDQPEVKKVIKIDVRKIIWGAAATAILIILVILMIKVKDNFYPMRHKIFPGRKKDFGGLDFDIDVGKKRWRKK